MCDTGPRMTPSACFARSTTSSGRVVPAARSDAKLKKAAGPPEPITLVENPDVLRELSGLRRRPGQVIVGFAAETDPDLAAARSKLARKGCDLLVMNQVGGGRGFGTADNEAVILAADGRRTQVPFGPKETLAEVIWDLVAGQLADADRSDGWGDPSRP